MTEKGRRCLLAGAAAYVALIYATSGLVRPLQGALKALAGGHYSLAMNLAIFLGGVFFLLYYREGLRGWGARRWGAACLLAAAYVGAARLLPVPEERFHLLQYGFLAWLLTEGAAGRWTGGPLHVFSLALTVAAGAGDELVQEFRPNRVGDVRDVAINALSAALAQGALALVRPSAKVLK